MRLLYSLSLLALAWAAPALGLRLGRNSVAPDSTAVAPDGQIPAALKIDWSVPLPGRGLASPIIVGDKLFLTCASGPKQERLHLFCLDAANGRKIWERQLQATGRTMSHPKTSIASSTPCSDGRHVFALWSCNDLAAFDLEGNLLWVRGLTTDYPNASNSLGMASSPIVIGETVVVTIENDSESYSLGVDAKTGCNLWKLDRPKAANWSSPVPWRAGAHATPVAVLQSSKGLLAVDPASGSRLWEYTEGASTTSSSVVASGIIYAASNGVTALSPDASNAAPKQLWRSKQINPATISPLVLGGSIFSCNNAGVILAGDIKTGSIQWKLRLTGPFSGSPVGAGSRLLAVNEKGLVQVVETSASEGKLIGQVQLPLNTETKENILCTPAISGNHVYVRTDSTLWRLGE
ncbi:Pyrrolo-quinoline quinone [Chthoniobacter flavus Ellin428]|uniref:Pyrrolo-quinoline quinone n=1 Tax=Chthoniobacter flavus Ellin428 TaxID=497964 RepID=B4CWY4_9BACT|nr:PQQ-binding-like beta-propeller repeat protein [Chthoniobacter flavus]EDY21304.1 Pyrrolo-quinoline quinone [Chthoniobacter flavus Ellin428]